MGRLIRIPRQRTVGSRRGAVAATPPRAVIVSASVGAGHDAVAEQLAARLEEAGVAVDRHDFLDLMPGPTGRVFVGSYHGMISRAPWTWKLLYGGMDNARMAGMQASIFTALAGRRIRRAVQGDTTRIVIATYPLASQVLGRLRLTGKVSTPVHTYLTDFSVHQLWAAPGVDAHLALHQVAAAQARAAGCEQVSVVAPLVDRRFTPATPESRFAARARWGLPQDARLALLVGGSWGAGELERTVADVEAADPGITCVVVCGRNEALRERLLAAGVKHAHGWVDDMPSLMHAADVLVQNAGGMTVQEAVASALPVVTYRSIPGHGLTNAAALDEAGIARWARHSGELAAALAGALSDRVTPISSARRPGADAVQVLLASAGLSRPNHYAEAAAEAAATGSATVSAAASVSVSGSVSAAGPLPGPVAVPATMESVR
ncbi:MGDG synthase family glycosyltransferase [Streptacidiphilus carbonis]|uniref:MGDG synthase family glycosyltransferase n=1 Tax=Streptacidiphilus carbonis TaxID=105422 RepID=UPI0006947A80|nr:glycosyltransferase [Streptacidiphilus carbonis]